MTHRWGRDSSHATHWKLSPASPIRTRTTTINGTDPLGLAPAGDRKATPREVRDLAEELGDTIERIKAPGGRGAGQYDIYVGDDGEMTVKRKGSKGAGDPLGVNVRDLPSHNASHAGGPPSSLDYLSDQNCGYFAAEPTFTGGWNIFEIPKPSLTGTTLVGALVGILLGGLTTLVLAT